MTNRAEVVKQLSKEADAYQATEGMDRSAAEFTAWGWVMREAIWALEASLGVSRRVAGVIFANTVDYPPHPRCGTPAVYYL